MSKLWIFGCSFSVIKDDDCYVKMLAKKLNAKLMEVAMPGTSVGWMMYNSMQNRHRFAEDDYVIFQTTSIDRGFLDKDHPALSKISKRDSKWTSLTKQQQEGYTFYLLNIHDTGVLMTQFQAWLHAMAHYTKHLQIPPLLTAGWDLGDLELPDKWRQSKGLLWEASVKEFNVTPLEFRDWLQTNGNDPRHNHFSGNNHKIITDIYYKALTDKNYIPDFTNLEQNIYDELPKLGMAPHTWMK